MKIIKKIEPQGWTLDEFVKVLNGQLGETEGASHPSYDDERFRQELSPRNLRRLAAEGAMDPPDRFGRDARYGERHLQQALEARALMSRGFTCSAIRALRAASSEISNESPLFDPNASGNALFPSSERPLFSAISPASSQPLFAASPPSSALSSLAFFEPEKEAPSAARATAFLDSLNDKQPRSAQASNTLAGSLGSSYLGSSPSYSKSLSAPLAAASLPRSGPMASPLPPGFAPKLSVATSSQIEIEPFEGLRISVRSANAQAPLTDEMKAQALEALQSAWERARQGG